MRTWLVSLGLWIARHGGWSEGPIQEAATAPYQDALFTVRSELHDTRNDLRALKARMALTATVSPDVFDRTQEMVADAETTLSGGEAKRHAVYARLMKAFPTIPKRELGLAIELVLAKEG